MSLRECVAKIKVNNNSPHSVEGIKSRKTVKLLEAHEAKRRRSDLYTQYVGRSSNPRLNTDTINKIKPFYGGNDAQDAQAAANLALKADADKTLRASPQTGNSTALDFAQGHLMALILESQAGCLTNWDLLVQKSFPTYKF